MKSIFPATTRARFALIIVITLVPVFGTTFLSYLREKHVLLSHIKEDVMRVTRIAAGTQELAINGAFQLLMALAITMPKGEQAAQKLLAGLQNANPVYKAIGFVAPDGTLVSTSSNIPPIDFSTHREGNMDFAIDAWFEEGPRSGLVMSHYFRIDSRESKAAFFALIDMKQFYGFTGLQLPDDSEYLLLTEKGVVLAASPSANMWARKDSPLIAAILSRREGTIELGGRDGKTRLYAFKPLSSVADTGVYISVGLPLSVYSELDNLLALDLLVFVFSIIAGFLIWTLTDRTLISRVNSLVGTAKKLSAGEMKARTGLKHNSRGEIERIAEALDQLAETLEHRNVQLESYQEQLRSM
ncbi:MAG: HAMP domain-containing protein, partial [Syntrophobacteraceae bacterium]